MCVVCSGSLSVCCVFKIIECVMCSGSLSVCCVFRICGNTAKTTDISASVREEMRKHFIKKKWRVSSK